MLCICYVNNWQNKQYAYEYIHLYARLYPSHYPNDKQKKQVLHSPALKPTKKTFSSPTEILAEKAATSRISPSKTSRDVEYSKQPGRLSRFSLGFPSPKMESWNPGHLGATPKGHALDINNVSLRATTQWPYDKFLCSSSQIYFVHHHYCNSHNQRERVDIWIKVQWLIVQGTNF